MNRTTTVWLLILLCSGLALAQSTAGSGAVGGTVRDNNGEGLPDTDVMIDNQSLALERTAGTSDDGVFQAPGIVAGPGYKLKITRKGFQPWESAEFSVPVGQTVNFDIRLQAAAGTGQPATAAVYTSGGGKVGMTSAFSEEQIESLPLMQRRIDPMVAVVPLVTTDAGGDQISIVGQNIPAAFLTDGMVTRDSYFQQRPPVDLAPLDAIQGFEVLEADAPPEFGHTSNGIVNEATRGGTNSYHGAAYGYLRIPGLTAVGRYSDGLSLLQDRNQSGVNVGGPVLASKLFFFTDFEVINDHFNGLNRITNQLIADPTGTTVAAANCKATAALCTAAEKFIQSQMNVVVPLSMRSIDGIARVDYRLNSWNSLNFAANLTNSLAPDWSQVSSAASNGGLLGIRNTRDDSRYVNAGVTTSLFSSTTNELRIGESQHHIFDPSSFSGLSTGDVGVSVAGVNVGDSNPNSSLVTERRYQLVDNYTAPLDSHTFQFGFDGLMNHFFIDSLPSIPEFQFASLTNFATDLSSTTGTDYSLLTQSLGLPKRDFTLGEYDVYAQDTWRATPALTVTFGVRWDLPLLPKPNGTNTAFYQADSIPSTKLDLAARAGIAYRVKNKTVVRLAYGLFYQPFTGQLLDALVLGNAQSQANLAIAPTLTGAPAFPAGIPVTTSLSASTVVNSLPVCNYGICTVNSSSSGSIPAGAEEVAFTNNKFPNPHTQQVSLSAERRLDSNTTLTLGVIDVRSLRLTTATDYNLNAPTESITYAIENAAGARTGTFTTPVFTAFTNQAYSHVYQVGYGGSARYDAATVEVRRQMSRGLMFQASYTWSHAFDDLSGLTIPGGIPDVETNTAVFTPNRASSPTDQRQRLVINGSWQPAVRSKSLAARYLINGWQISPILTMASGHPVTATVAADQLAITGLVTGTGASTPVTPLFPNTLDGYGGTTRVPFLPVDAYTTGTERNLDLRFAKAIPITERVRAMLMFDIFNTLNSQWITGLNTVAYQASAGIIRAVPGAGGGEAAVQYPYGTNARNMQVAFRVTF